jgi:L-threonylcarbamoyladenylate synthase
VLNWQTRRSLVQHYDRSLAFAYPTEAVFGLGCNPWSPEAVQRVFDLKGRPRNKGLIIVASHIDQLKPFLAAITPEEHQVLLGKWPGPQTFVIPLPDNHPWWWLTPQYNSLALRVSAHPVVQAVCQLLGPVVSTSANPSGLPAAKNTWQVRRHFPQLRCIVGGAVGDAARPTQITELRTGRVLRK